MAGDHDQIDGLRVDKVKDLLGRPPLGDDRGRALVHGQLLGEAREIHLCVGPRHRPFQRMHRPCMFWCQDSK